MKQSNSLQTLDTTYATKHLLKELLPRNIPTCEASTQGAVTLMYTHNTMHSYQ